MVKMKQKRQLSGIIRNTLVVAGMVFVIAGCGKPADDDTTLTPTPEITSEVQDVEATATPEPTVTPEPTATPRPTSTPRPTATPKPTPTPEPLPANNIVKNATFDSDTTGWGLYTESEGEGTVTCEDGKLALNVTSLGKLNYSVQIYPEDVISLEQGVDYRVRYEISSTEKCSIEVMIQQNGGSYQTYTWKKVELTPATQALDYEFTMTGNTDTNTKLVFNCGTQGEDTPVHTIYLDNVSVSKIDNTSTKKDASEYEPAIRVNQVGYLEESVKKAVLADMPGVTKVSVVNAETEEVVYTGDVYGEKYTSSTNEINSFVDFTKVEKEGRYYLVCGDVKSHTFTIGDDVYDGLMDDLVRMFYLQRCGGEVVDDTFGHAACHTGLAKVYGTEDKIDVSGGWHDAGDYGRYIVPAAKSVADLLYAYEEEEDAFSDNIGAPYSGNGIPDVLDEVRYELEWMLKMQAEDGGVHHKVSTAAFGGFLMPERETGLLIVTPVSTTATADFCASMALAYEFYYEIDKAFAENCLAAAEKAWAFLEANPELIFENPATITTGSYEDGNDTDERYWAAAQMYRATKDAKYFTALEGMQAKTGLDWSTVGDYGNIALLTMDDDEIDVNSSVYAKAKKAIMDQAERYEKNAANSTYGTANLSFNWGSNMTVSNYGVILGIAYELTDDEKYLTAAQSNLHYLLGKNPVDTCFVTGYGTISPKNPHHRPSAAKKQAMPGMLVGGVASGLEDPTAKSKLKDAPVAKRYIDHQDSYSTNEITIYWNSPLIYLMTLADD